MNDLVLIRPSQGLVSCLGTGCGPHFRLHVADALPLMGSALLGADCSSETCIEPKHLSIYMPCTALA